MFRQYQPRECCYDDDIVMITYRRTSFIIYDTSLLTG